MNLHNAINGYGLSTNSLHTEIAAQLNDEPGNGDETGGGGTTGTGNGSGTGTGTGTSTGTNGPGNDDSVVFTTIDYTIITTGGRADNYGYVTYGGKTYWKRFTPNAPVVITVEIYSCRRVEISSESCSINTTTTTFIDVQEVA